jgi:hypothetical protein
MSVREAIDALAKISTHEDLKRVSDALRQRWNQVSATAAQELMAEKRLLPGQAVKFKGRGQSLVGKVKSVNTKTVTVDVKGFPGGWRVSPGLVAVATEEELKAFEAKVAPEGRTDGHGAKLKCLMEGRTGTNVCSACAAVLAKEAEEEMKWEARVS